MIIVKLTKRQQIAIAKRRAVMASKAYREWWEWRQTIQPTPTEPYRAYMIDLSLEARLFPKGLWKHRTNRADYPAIDLPLGMPAPKRRVPPRKHFRRYKPVPAPAIRLERTAFQKELEQELRAFEEAYHLPPTKLIFEKYRRGGAYSPELRTIYMPTTSTEKKVPLASEQPLVIMLHEAGHHAHFAYGGAEKAMGTSLQGIILEKPAIYGKGRIPTERTAWKIAKHYLGKRYTPRMGWQKRWSFGTYLGISPRPKED